MNERRRFATCLKCKMGLYHGDRAVQRNGMLYCKTCAKGAEGYLDQTGVFIKALSNAQ